MLLTLSIVILATLLFWRLDGEDAPLLSALLIALFLLVMAIFFLWVKKRYAHVPVLPKKHEIANAARPVQIMA